ncbi:MAG: DUF2007 domain-containing protein [Ignavibacteriales bacterium]|nr:DUF2007 domain-containing protein [Ignavibacteriales bacterium]
MEGYVVVATFLNEIDAELAQATLAAAGIESFLQYEDTGHMMPVLQQSEGVKILVNPKDLKEAKIILSTPISEKNME